MKTGYLEKGREKLVTWELNKDYAKSKSTINAKFVHQDRFEALYSR